MTITDSNFQLQKLQAQSNRMKRQKIIELQNEIESLSHQPALGSFVYYVTLVVGFIGAIVISMRLESELTIIIAALIPLYCLIAALIMRENQKIKMNIRTRRSMKP